MMLILTVDDIHELTPECQRELQEFLFRKGKNVLFPGVPDPIPPLEPDVDDSEPFFIEEAVLDNSVDKKKVFEINEIQAKALISNLSEKSISTLRLFVDSEMLSLDELVGVGKPYSSFVEFKRSFIGAVNRRLRTVTRDRGAMLFRKTSAPEGSQEWIGIKPKSMNSLKLVL